ncbi:hypothetical protein [uncultured Mycobacterium sp.]|uniref:hypothetical protein n=1 Tax=uncultured Mycobacterium sp. TaxID=171292 RepID=UPI0035CBA367
MNEKLTLAGTTNLALGDLFTSGTALAYSVEGFLAVVGLVIGTVAAIQRHSKEGAGSGITSQIGAIVFAVLIFLSAGIAAAVTHEFNNHGIRNSVNVPNPWGQ